MFAPFLRRAKAGGEKLGKEKKVRQVRQVHPPSAKQLPKGLFMKIVIQMSQDHKDHTKATNYCSVVNFKELPRHYFS